jgi:hypothetical protein
MEIETVYNVYSQEENYISRGGFRSAKFFGAAVGIVINGY